jgi:multimeric flavodoxin WrbA
MIHMVAISGSPVINGNTDVYLQRAMDSIASNPEIKIDIFHLAERQITGCRHCNWCIKKQTADKFCAISDGMDEIYPALVRSDAIILATPVHLGRMSGLLANMMDRLRVFVYGNIHREKLKDKVGGALIVAFLRHGGLELTLQVLNTSFALFQMIAIGRGGLALTSMDGTGKTLKGVRHMVLEDSLGLMSAKDMIQRAVEIARIIQAGKKALQPENP